MNVEKNIKTVFFVKQGMSKAQVIFNKDSFFHGETASAIVKIDNSACEKDIKYVKFKLRRIIYGKATDNWTYKLNQTLIKVEYPGIQAGQTGTVNVEMPLNYNKDLEPFEKYLDKQQEKHHMG